MSKSIVKKALEMLDDDEKPRTKFNKIVKKKQKKSSETSSMIQDRKQLAKTCAALKKLSKPVVTTDQIEQLNNYRFGGPSKRDLSNTKTKKKEEENIFTQEDFERFQREYNPPLRKS